MSDQPRPTPRSDRAAGYVNNQGVFVQSDTSRWHVQVDFARLLERESDARADTIAALANNLAASDNKNASLRGEVKAIGEEISELRRLLREATEALEKSIERDSARAERIAELEKEEAAPPETPGFNGLCIEPGCGKRKPDAPHVPGPPCTPMPYVCPDHESRYKRDSMGRLYLRPEFNKAIDKATRKDGDQ